MVSKKKKKRAKQQSAGSTAQQVERLVSRGNFKQAVKDARVCYRQQPTDLNRRLLEQAYLGRAQELHRLDMRSESRAILESLLELGVSDPGVKQALPELLVAAGMMDRVSQLHPEGGGEVEQRLLTAAADHAVLRPEEAPASRPELRQGALNVRAALEALAAGDEGQAMTRVQPIARTSPFADWKLFVRGLAAYYRQDTAGMQANWRRLASGRAAARIAARLEELAGTSSGKLSPQATMAMRKLESQASGQVLLPLLHELREHLARDQWNKAMQALRRSRDSLRRLDPGLRDRLALLLCSRALRRRDQEELLALTRAMDPPAIDPHWNRARALLWEMVPDLLEMEQYWRKYADDLGHMPSLSAEERSLARALVSLHLAEQFAGAYAEEAEEPYGDEDDLDELYEQAVEYFDHCLKVRPDLLPAYQKLGRFQVRAEKPDQAAATYERLLEKFPEELEALVYVAKRCLRTGDAIKARDYSQRAHRLRPLVVENNSMLRKAHLAAACHYATQQQWEAGRQELAAAGKLSVPGEPGYVYLAAKAAFHWKAGQAEQAKQLAQQAQDTLEEPTAALLALAIEASRYSLPRADRQRIEKRLKSALKKRCHSQTAAEMSRLMHSVLTTDSDYPGSSEHLQQVLAYLRRCTRVKWQSADLRRACRLLLALAARESLAQDQQRMLDRFIDKGRELVPQDGWFWFWSGEREYARGPGRCDTRFAQYCFERALELGQESGGPEDAAWIETAKERQAFLDELASRMSFGMPFGMPFPFEDFEEDEDEEDEEDEDEDDVLGRAPEELLELIQRMCEAMGLDLEEVMRDLARGEGPFGSDFDFGAPPAPRAKQTKKAQRKKGARR